MPVHIRRTVITTANPNTSDQLTNVMKEQPCFSLAQSFPLRLTVNNCVYDAP